MERFRKDSYLYNYAAAKATDAPFVFLVEGVPDVLRLAEAGLVGVALLGCDASEEQIGKLRALGKGVWLTMDSDEAGKAAWSRLVRRLNKDDIRLGGLSFEAPAPYKDLGEMPVAELRAAVLERLEGQIATEEMFGDEDRVRKAEGRLRAYREWEQRKRA